MSVQSTVESTSDSTNDQSIKHPYFWEQDHLETPPLRIAVYQCVSIPQRFGEALNRLIELAQMLGVDPNQSINQTVEDQSTDRSIMSQSIHQIHQPVDLLVVPELWLCGYDIHKLTIRKNSISLNSPEMQRIRDVCKTYRIAMSIGYAERIDQSTNQSNDSKSQPHDEYNGPLYNSSVTIDVDGSIAHNYRKTHLWQEYEKDVFEPGCDLRSFSLKSHPAHRFGTLICWDIEFPEAARELCLQGVSVLIVHTALDAINDTANVIPMCTVPTRACENHMFVAYSNFCSVRRPRGTIDDEELCPMCGLSGIFAPDGHEIARASSNQTQLLIGECKPAGFVTHFKHMAYLPHRRVDLMKLHTVPREYEHTPMTRAEIQAKKEEEQLYGDDKLISQIISMENDK